MSSRLPDRFDLWVRKARESPDPARQVDYILGALAALSEWCFLNTGSPTQPQIARSQIGPDPCVLVFSNPDRVGELIEAAPRDLSSGAPTLLTIPTAGAFSWCLENKLGLLVNPGDDSVLIPFGEVSIFHGAWLERGGLHAGFWIPSMTSREEDFWQEHGL